MMLVGATNETRTIRPLYHYRHRRHLNRTEAFHENCSSGGFCSPDDRGARLRIAMENGVNGRIQCCPGFGRIFLDK
jgi:hypothetical protein